MSWIPPDLSALCQPHTTVTICSPASVMFLQLITRLFNFSVDDKFASHNRVHDWRTHPGGVTFGTDDWVHNYAHGNWDWNQKQTFGIGGADIPNYDFIIIGAGSAGCVLARRLSEIKDWRILLLEAGIEEPAIADVPAFAIIVDNSNIDWGFMTQPEHHSCRAFPDGRCHWVRGKVMGGSSTVNYMIYIRGNPADYDEWAAMGNPGWSYEHVLPYFKKSEDNEDPEIAHDKYHHGTGGPQTVEWFPYQDENVPVILAGLYHAGYPELDQNAGEQLGAMRLQTTSRHGLRLSTNGAFIRPIRRKRRNLRVETGAHVTRILIDPKTKNAFGVEYLQNGQMKYAIAQKEVLLSAGTINSPIILKNSGVGPAEELHKFQIPVLCDLPVGKNLQDHVTFRGLIFGLTNHSSTISSQHQQIKDVYTFFKHKSGPLSATGSLQVNAFYQTVYEHEHGVPDIQYAFDVTNVQDFYTEPTMANIAPLSYYNGLLLRPILLHPESRGEILLNTTDPVFGSPLIYPNFFTKYPDLERLIEGINEGMRILETPIMQKIGAIIRIRLPACKKFEYGTKDYWQCVIMSYTDTIYHPVGTNKMGPKTDKTAVVDHQLRVHCIKRLRVIDASIMPKIPSGNTNAPTIMIGEKASDMIKHTWL